MSAGLRKTPHEMWVLFDVDNGDYPVKNYLWWFPTQQEAEEHKRQQLKRRFGATLIGPYKYHGKSIPTRQAIGVARKKRG